MSMHACIMHCRSIGSSLKVEEAKRQVAQCVKRPIIEPHPSGVAYSN